MSDAQNLHPRLDRLLKRVGISGTEELPDPEQWRTLLDRISQAYADADAERYLHDRALTVSSAEMQHLYNELAKQSALATEHGRLETVLNTTQTGLCLVDENRQILEINSAAAAVLGLDRAAARGQSIEPLLWPGMDGRVPREFRLAIANKTAWQGELVQPRGDTLGLTCNISYTPLAGSSDAADVGGVLAFHDLTEQHRAEADLAWRSRHDALTGLLNRGAMVEHIQASLPAIHEAGTTCAVLFVDLDHFKTINDTVGHDAGDTALVEAAHRILGAVRGNDLVARLGGDEFVVFLQDVPGPYAATQVAERILRDLRQPFDVAGQHIFISGSAGVVLSNGDQPAGQLLQNADIAAYTAKSQGRDQALVFDADLHDTVRQRVRLDGMLRSAVANQELDVAYQPIISLRGGGLMGYESLARWNSPQGVISPDVFIPLAEQTGTITAIGDFVLERATCLLHGMDVGPGLLQVAINVSGVQLARGNFARHIAAHLQSTGLSGRSLIVELTESTLLTNTESVISQLQELRALGVEVAIDDFGTGWSSLSLLRQFPIDYIKIDRGFVAAVASDQTDTAIVRAMIELAHALGLRVIAEGVEHRRQLEALRRLGCDYAQGYHVGRPVVRQQLNVASPVFAGGS